MFYTHFFPNLKHFQSIPQININLFELLGYGIVQICGCSDTNMSLFRYVVVQTCGCLDM